MKVASNLVRDIKKYYREQLCSIYDYDEANSLVLILLEHYFKIDKIKMALVTPNDEPPTLVLMKHGNPTCSIISSPLTSNLSPLSNITSAKSNTNTTEISY